MHDANKMVAQTIKVYGFMGYILDFSYIFHADIVLGSEWYPMRLIYTKLTKFLAVKVAIITYPNYIRFIVQVHEANAMVAQTNKVYGFMGIHFKLLIHITDFLKCAQVTTLHKKNDPMNKSNFRPDSILTSISKLYEKVISEQLSQYFEDIFNKYLCAFRKGQGCQTTLLRLLEDWKQALDKNEYVAAV